MNLDFSVKQRKSLVWLAFAFKFVLRHKSKMTMNYKQIEFAERNNAVLMQSVKGHWKFMFVLH